MMERQGINYPAYCPKTRHLFPKKAHHPETSARNAGWEKNALQDDWTSSPLWVEYPDS
jgi:hypothetical protein